MKTTKIYLLVASFVFAAALMASAASEERFNRNVAAHRGGKLVVDVDFGKVDVSPGADDNVTVEAVRLVDFDNEAKEKEYLAAAPITLSVDGNAVTLREHAPKEARLNWPHHSRMDARYVIRVPKNFSADLQTGGGGVSVTGLTGEVQANSGGGDLRFSKLEGDLDAQTGGGGIKLEDCRGTLELATGGGDLVFTGGTGSLRARAGGGRIEVRDFKGDTKVSSGGGQLTLERIDGAVWGETGGGSITASFGGSALKKIELESSGGDIELALPRSAAADITADTSSGRVTTDLPLEITRKDDDHLRGKLNGGGAPVRLRTSGGSIRISSPGGATASR